MTDLKIHYARYGISNHKKNVAKIVRANISDNDRLNFLVCNDNLGGDRYSGKPKELHIIYSFNGVLYDRKISENDVLVIPELSPKPVIPKNGNNIMIVTALSAVAVLISIVGAIRK